MIKTVEDSIWSNIFKRGGDEVPKDIIETLRKVPIFSDLTNRELEKVGRISHMREYGDNEPIFHEGQPGAGMYIIRVGKIRIVQKTVTGEEQELSILMDGEFFGDLGLLDNSPRTAAAISIGRSQIIGLFRPELLKLIDKDSNLGCKILLKLAKVIAARLRHADKQLKKALQLESKAATYDTHTSHSTHGQLPQIQKSEEKL